MESIRPPGKLRSASRSWTLCAIQGDKTELDLSDRSLGAGCAALLSYELKDHKAITCLNLSTNNLGPVGARQIAKAVETNRTFIALDLSDCNLCNIDENGEGVRDDSGVTAIVQAVKTSRFRIRILTRIGVELANHIVHTTGAFAFCMSATTPFLSKPCASSLTSADWTLFVVFLWLN
jgi:hypothetical protein